MMFAKLLPLAFVAAAPAMAQDAPVGAQVAPDKKICRKEAPKTGSIMFAKRVCKTKAEWDAIDAVSEQARDRQMIDRNRGASGLGRNGS